MELGYDQHSRCGSGGTRPTPGKSLCGQIKLDTTHVDHINSTRSTWKSINEIRETPLYTQRPEGRHSEECRSLHGTVHKPVTCACVHVCMCVRVCVHCIVCV